MGVPVHIAIVVRERLFSRFLYHVPPLVSDGPFVPPHMRVVWQRAGVVPPCCCSQLDVRTRQRLPFFNRKTQIVFPEIIVSTCGMPYIVLYSLEVRHVRVVTTAFVFYLSVMKPWSGSDEDFSVNA